MKNIYNILNKHAVHKRFSLTQLISHVISVLLDCLENCTNKDSALHKLQFTVYIQTLHNMLFTLQLYF